MANEYATSTELKKTLELTGESFADDDVALALTAASRAIDRTAKRRFWHDSDATKIRYYSPASATRLDIDDLVTLTELATGGGDNTFTTVWTVNVDFILEPLNGTADGLPYRVIRSLGKSLPTVPRSVRVTGKFGWPAVPDEVKQATIVLASKLMRRAREAPFGVLAFAEGGEVARIARTDPDVAMLIGPFLRRLVR